MEINTCEQYVLAKLKEAEERIADLELQLMSAKETTSKYRARIEELEFRVDTLRRLSGETNEPI